MASTRSATPTVTIAIASYNSAAFIEPAIRSALNQTLTDIEVVVVDDASPDDSAAMIERMAASDPRIRLERLAQNAGPAGARNRALDVACGRWLAVLDSDDLLHPDRLRRMVERAEADGADMIADDLMLFEDGDASAARRLLNGRRAKQDTWISTEDYLLETRLFGRAPNLGYLKPLFRLDRWRSSGLRYNENLRIAEDSDLVLRMLACGWKFRLSPQLGYFYRKHPASISHRMGGGHVDRMRQAEQRFRSGLTAPSPSLIDALDRHRASIETAGAFVNMIDQLKSRRPAAAVAQAIKRPQGAVLMWMPLLAAAKRLTPKPRPKPVSNRIKVCFISRQRIVGPTNGSSRYLLALAQAVRDAGMEPHLVQPSPTLLGRWLFMRLRPEMAVFESIQIRGLWRRGSLLVATSPRVYSTVAKTAANMAAGKLKLPRPFELPPVQHAITLPWLPEDELYIARHATPLSDRVVCDYIFCTRALPYLTRSRPPSAVVMHDLYFSRGSAFSSQTIADSVQGLSQQDELDMLAMPDAVVAIQDAEGAYVREHLPGAKVIVAPIAAEPVAAPQPGAGDVVLFVGSNTPPNIDALEWFFAKIWPEVRRRKPGAVLKVAGGVARAFPNPPAGVEFLGLVHDLEPLYAEAAVVISPLNLGSGLKIKLIEALARGKAIVATSVTLQGVERQAGEAVASHDDPGEFGDAVVRLLGDGEERRAMGAMALTCVKDHFSPAACYGGLIDWLRGAG